MTKYEGVHFSLPRPDDLPKAPPRSPPITPPLPRADPSLVTTSKSVFAESIAPFKKSDERALFDTSCAEAFNLSIE